MEFTQQDLDDFWRYEEVRLEGKYNMFDPMARYATGLTREVYLFVMGNYSELKKADMENRSNI